MTDTLAGEEIYKATSLSATGKIGSPDLIHQLQMIGAMDNETHQTILTRFLKKRITIKNLEVHSS